MNTYQTLSNVAKLDVKHGQRKTTTEIRLHAAAVGSVGGKTLKQHRPTHTLFRYARTASKKSGTSG